MPRLPDCRPAACFRTAPPRPAADLKRMLSMDDGVRMARSAAFKATTIRCAPGAWPVGLGWGMLGYARRLVGCAVLCCVGVCARGAGARGRACGMQGQMRERANGELCVQKAPYAGRRECPTSAPLLFAGTGLSARPGSEHCLQPARPVRREACATWRGALCAVCCVFTRPMKAKARRPRLGVECYKAYVNPMHAGAQRRTCGRDGTLVVVTARTAS